MIIECPQLKKQIECPSGVNLLTALSAQGISLARSCGGEGICGTCRVRIVGENLPPLSALEKRLLAREDKGEKGSPAEEGVLRFACLLTLPGSSKKWILRTDYW